MWYFVVFQPSKCKKTHFQPQIWSIWPIFPNDSESLPKVCYIKRKNSEILSRLGLWSEERSRFLRLSWWFSTWAEQRAVAVVQSTLPIITCNKRSSWKEFTNTEDRKSILTIFTSFSSALFFLSASSSQVGCSRLQCPHLNRCCW